MPSAVAFIPARAGSERVPGKNVRALAGHPLIAYSIAAARESGLFDAIVVSTDSEEIAEVARRYGAEVPVLRPAEIATATSPDIEWVRHMLDALGREGRTFEIFSLLRPTSPFRERGHDPPRVGPVPGDRTAGGLDPRRRALPPASRQDVGDRGRADASAARRRSRARSRRTRASTGRCPRCTCRTRASRSPGPGSRPTTRSRASASSRSSPRARGLHDRLSVRLGARGADGRRPAPRCLPGRRLMEAATVTAPQQVQDLRYVPLDELRRLRELDADPVERAHAFADACRINILYMIMRAGSGHIGTSFSSIDIVSWLHLEVLRDDDVYFSSKGHDAPALYAVLIGTGRLAVRDAPPACAGSAGCRATPTSRHAGGHHQHRLARDGDLEGEGVRARGAASRRAPPRLRAHRRRRAAGGSVLGVADAGGERGVRRDHGDRGPQQDPVRHLGRRGVATSATSRRSCARSAGRWAAATATTSAPCRRRWTSSSVRAGERPKILVADTVKGAGVGFMEPRDLERSGTALYAFHSGAPSDEQYGRGAGRARGAPERTARAERSGSRPARARGGATAGRAAESAAARRRVRGGAGRGGRATSRGSSRSTPTSTSTPG